MNQLMTSLKVDFAVFWFIVQYSGLFWFNIQKRFGFLRSMQFVKP